MNKYKLTRFIDKYHLGGNVNAVVINSKGDSLTTRFITGDKALLGELSMDNWTFEDAELGVYDTEQLSRLLGVLDDDVTLNLTQSGDKAIGRVLQFAQTTPFQIETVTKAFIALKSAGIEPTNRMLQTFADTASVS